MACSAYISYQLGGNTESAATVVVASRARNKPSQTTSPISKKTTTSFVLVDPSSSSLDIDVVTARKKIRKHASKACAAQRLATIAAKKKSRNVLTKKERQRKQAAERLEAALLKHVQKLSPTVESVPCFPAQQPAQQAPKQIEAPVPTVEQQSPPEEPTATKSSAKGSPVKTAPYEFTRKRCSISWLLTPPSSTTTPTEEDGEPGTKVKSDTLIIAPSAVAGMYSSRLDPFSTFPVDVKDDGSLAKLFDFMDKSIFPLMDLRLPMTFDKVSGTRRAHSKELPHFVLGSEPLFWTMALCAGTIFTLRNRQKPGAEPITMGYRYMAIKTINQHIARLGDESIYDVGLIYAIASLGVWEREKGSKEVWAQHCQGIEMLSAQLRRASQHHLLDYIVSTCHTAGSVPLEYHPNEGFRRVGDGNTLDPNLICAIYECVQLDNEASGPDRADLIESVAGKVMAYRSSDNVPKALCGDQGRSIEGDQRNLEMHVLLQGAGASLVRYLGKGLDLVPIQLVDFEETCAEAIDLAISVSAEHAYNELLLWAIFTTFALNEYSKPDALEIVIKLLKQLGMQNWTQLKASLTLFVYLNTAESTCQEYWNILQMHMSFQDSHSPALLPSTTSTANSTKTGG